VPRLPIIADKWWAWLLGFYFGAGNAMKSYRAGPKSRPGGFTAMYVKLRANDEVIPRLLEVAKHTGIKAMMYVLRGPKYRGEGKQRVTGRREYIVLGWPEYYVLRKFGLPTAWEEWTDRRKIQMASPNYKPVIPEWIKEDDDLMHSFIEGFLATAKVTSALTPRKDPRSGRIVHRITVAPNMVGTPDEYIKQFMTDIYFWFMRQGYLGFLRKVEEHKASNLERSKYELSYTDIPFCRFLLSRFNIYKSELRARLLAKVEAEEDPILYEALRVLRNPDNVVLGLLLEQPLTTGDIEDLLLMKPEGIKLSLKSLMDKGIVTKKEDYYYYDPKVFAERKAKKYNESAEEYLEKINLYMNSFLHQCSQCNHVYIKETTVCSYCNGKVLGVSRHDVVRRMDTKRRYDLYIANTLSEIR